MKYEFRKSGKLYKVIAAVIMLYCDKCYGENYSVLFGFWPAELQIPSTIIQENENIGLGVNSLFQY